MINTVRDVLWVLRLGDAEVLCEARLLPSGVEARIVWNGRELYAFLLPTGEEALAWAEEKRQEYEARGFAAAEPRR